MTTQDTNTDKTADERRAAIDEQAEKTLGQLMVREGLRTRGMAARQSDWATETWNEAKGELADKEGSDETIAAMEVAETIAHAHSVLGALKNNIENARKTINESLDEILRHTQEALDGVGDGYLGDVKLWPGLQSLCRAMGTMRGTEAILSASIEAAFGSFYESAQAIKVVHAAQQKHDEAMGEDDSEDADE